MSSASVTVVVSVSTNSDVIVSVPDCTNSTVTNTSTLTIGAGTNGFCVLDKIDPSASNCFFGSAVGGITQKDLEDSLQSISGTITLSSSEFKDICDFASKTSTSCGKSQDIASLFGLTKGDLTFKNDCSTESPSTPTRLLTIDTVKVPATSDATSPVAK